MTSQTADRRASPLIAVLVLGLLAAHLSPGAVASGPPEPVPLAMGGGCGHCLGKDDIFAKSRVVFGATVDALNDQGLTIPVNGGDVWREAAGLRDSDGDFLADPIEGWILATSVFEVEDDNDLETADPVLFHSEWNIRVSHHGGFLYDAGPLLEITIRSDGDHLALDVCPWQEETELINQHTAVGPCLIESRDLSEIEFGIMPAGFWIEALGPTSTRELFFAVDLENLGSETLPIVHLELGAAVTMPTNGSPTTVASGVSVMSNPFGVLVGGEDVGVPPAAGMDHGDEGQPVLYIDTNLDGAGDLDVPLPG